MIRSLSILSLALVGAGCARDDTRYPSLAVRPVEQLGFDEPKAAPVGPVAGDPALDAQLGDLTKQLASITTAFDSDLANAERSALAARDAAVGSEPWLTAQTDLATLDTGRAALTDLITTLDDTARARAAGLTPPYPALVELRAHAVAESNRENQATERVNAMVPKA